MNKFAVFVLTLTTFVLISSVKSLRCYQGQRTVELQEGNAVSSTVESKECTDSTHVCVRTVTLTFNAGITSKKSKLEHHIYIYGLEHKQNQKSENKY